MAIYVKTSDGEGISYVAGGEPEEIELDILADTEAEITSLGTEVVIGGCCTVKAKPKSVAYTADLKVGYLLSPSGTWTKFRG